MLISLLALGLQTATVSNAQAGTAMRCAVATVVEAASLDPNASSDSNVRTTAQFMHFVMHAAVQDPAGKPFVERIGELATSVDPATVPDPAAAKTLLVACDRQFPLARTQAPARLPADPFKRDVMCFGVLSLMNGAAEEIGKAGDTSTAQRFKQALEPYNARLGDEVLTARGLGEQNKFLDFMGAQIRASMALGNPDTIARACGLKDA